MRNVLDKDGEKMIIKNDNEPIEVKVEDIMITGIAIHSITSKIFKCKQEIDWLTEHTPYGKHGIYYITEIDENENFLSYLMTYNADSQLFAINDNDEKLCMLANQPLTEIQKLKIILQVIEKYGFTDYVADMVEAKRLSHMAHRWFLIWNIPCVWQEEYWERANEKNVEII